MEDRDYERYYESNNEKRRREGFNRYLRMMDAQAKELTDSMVRFEDETHVLRIVDESRGFLTVLVRQRRTGEVLHRVRFKKQPKLGVVYTFYKSDKLSFLAIERELLPKLEAAAVEQTASFN